MDNSKLLSDRDTVMAQQRASAGLNFLQETRPVVLVVDDTTDNLRLMQAILKSEPYDVVLASDGPTALQMVKASPPDLILLDVMMPGMDGYEVCRQLKAEETTQHIPVIFVTALHDVEAETRGFAAGGEDFITKPLNVPVVKARVRSHLALYRQRRSLEGMFRDVIEFAPDAFILADRMGRMVQINARAEQLFGYSRDELVGRPVEVLMPPRLRGGHEGYRQAFVKAPRNLMMGAAVYCMRKDGTEFPADINLSPLQTNRGDLLMAVVRDVAERQRTETELNESRQRLRELAAQSEAARETERKHIAREVHDELGQVLTALRMDLAFTGMQFGAHEPALQDKVKSMKELVDRAIQGVRNVAGNLRPSALDMGLVAAIEWQCSEFFKHTQIPCQFHSGKESIDLDESRAMVIFRIVQESLTNITRYAQAEKVSIDMERRGPKLWLGVRDNGKGFDPAIVTKHKTYGLLGMRERALALGGQVEIKSAPGQGTLIEVTIPMSPEHVAKGES
jgi:PAS domain S-box-containing protein